MATADARADHKDVAGDTIRLGGPGRGADRRHDVGRAIESLFRAGYPRLVHAAYCVRGDPDQAERLAQKAYLRLWRRPRLIGDPRTAEALLMRTAVGSAPARAGSADRSPPRPVDTDRGWRDLRLHRARQDRNRRAARIAAIPVVAAVALAAAVPALLPGRSGARASGQAWRGRGQARPPAYPGAITARIPLSGVTDVLGDGQLVWAVRGVPAAAPASYQLVEIDTRTNTAAVSVSLGSQPEAVAVGGGTVWATTPYGSARGQLERIDPATGKVISMLHLRAGRCTYLAYSGAHLFARCDSSGLGATVFESLDPRTGRADWQTGPVPGQITQIAATPEGVWYADRYAGLAGPLATGGQVRPVPAASTSRRVSFANPQSLVYGDGFVWTLASDETVAKIDPASGRLVRLYTRQGYDPAFLGGLDYLAVGDRSLWLLDDGPPDAKGAPLGGVLRVSMATGRALGQVPGIAPGSCGQAACHQIYVTPGAVWIPTAQSLIRITPSRIPG